jgi:hypothetical protein
MNKNKLIRLHKDFSEGKFITPAQRKIFDLGFEKLNFLSKVSRLKIMTRRGPFSVSSSLFDKVSHPHLFVDIHNSLMNFASNSKEQKEQQYYGQAAFSSACLSYMQSYSKNPVSNENIYVITEKTHKTFSEIPLPDITFKDITFKNDLPALFLFEKLNTVVYLNYYLTPVDNVLELLISIFGYTDKFKFEVTNMVLFSNDIPSEIVVGQNLIKDFVSLSDKMEDSKDKDIINSYAKFFYNLLLFLACKETIKYQTEELNEERLTIEKNIAEGTNVKKNRQILDRLPSYRFIDMEVTMENFTREYYKNNPVESGVERNPHWRTGHWHTYWKGKKDGTEERKKVLKFIPTLWVGDPEKIIEQTSFKVIK